MNRGSLDPTGNLPLGTHMPKQAVMEEYTGSTEAGRYPLKTAFELFAKITLMTGCNMALTRNTSYAGQRNVRVVDFPTLEVARNAYSKYIGYENIPWDEI